MDISEFTLQKAILEVRYESAFLHFDRAGSIWHVASHEWPGLQINTVSPSTTSFVWKNLYAFKVELAQANVMMLIRIKFSLTQ